MTSSAATRTRRGAPAPSASGLASGELASTRFLLPATIRVVDEEKREIEVCATSESMDAHGTVFDYEASKDAFTRWLGNVREMHERRAVGTRIALRFDDPARKVYVRVRVSKGAQDTWEKVLDGTLQGASIGAANVSWTRQARNGQAVPVATRYDLAELSLVDAPSNPDTLGFTFVRDGVTLDDALDPLEVLEMLDVRATSASAEDARMNDTSAAPQAAQIVEPSGTLETIDAAEAIARAALERGLESLAAVQNVHNPRGGSVAPAIMESSATGPESREGSPTETPALSGRPAGSPEPGMGLRSARTARLAAAGIPIPVTRAMSAERASDGPGAPYDGDGDHDANVPAADTADLDSEMTHEPGMLAHEAHEHNHTGGYDDAHEHAGAHLHEDGSSHEHPHRHDHSHHDHHTAYRAAAGSHSHAHAHHHAHGHYYRIADGAAIDERMVSAEQVRTREYVSSAAFVAAGGVEGRALSAAQYRVAAGFETYLELEAARARGAFSRNPYGSSDIGTPAEAEAPAEPTHDELRDGRVRQLDRDGQPVTQMDPNLPAPNANGGTNDQSAAPEGYMQLTDGVSDGRVSVASVTRGIAASVEESLARALAPLHQRIAALEAQPQAGGPVFNGVSSPVEKRDALTPGVVGEQGNKPTVEERIAALRDVASRVSDPATQVELATQIILLQQEARGNTAAPANQAMPLAGNGALPRPRQRW